MLPHPHSFDIVLVWLSIPSLNNMKCFDIMVGDVGHVLKRVGESRKVLKIHI